MVNGPERAAAVFTDRTRDPMPADTRAQAQIPRWRETRTRPARACRQAVSRGTPISRACYTCPVHPQDLRDLVAHHEWLGSVGAALPATPDVLEAVHVLSATPGRTVGSFPPGGFSRLQRDRFRLRHRKRRESRWAKTMQRRRARHEGSASPANLVSAVSTNLQALCALRTRVTLRGARAEIRAQAAANVNGGRYGTRAERRRSAKIVDAIHGDAHIDELEPSLDQLQQRLRTAVRNLDRYAAAQKKRHKVLVKAVTDRMSDASGLAVLAQWIAMRCDSLHADIAFLRTEAQGGAATKPLGHAGRADTNDWYGVRREAKLRLKKAGAPLSLGCTLFPDGYGKPEDQDARRLRIDRERKQVKRAEKQKDSGK